MLKARRIALCAALMLAGISGAQAGNPTLNSSKHHTDVFVSENFGATSYVFVNGVGWSGDGWGDMLYCPPEIGMMKPDMITELAHNRRENKVVQGVCTPYSSDFQSQIAVTAQKYLELLIGPEAVVVGVSPVVSVRAHFGLIYYRKVLVQRPDPESSSDF